MALHSWGKPPIGIDELELSSVTNLYASGNLDASIATPSKLEPSAKINDMVILVQRDLTRLACDAIVNAANKSLLGGGGIDGAIHNVAGHDLYKECLHLNGCKTGEAKITKGYKLPATHVIHTVGPVYWTYKDNGEDPSVWLKSCYVASLDVARKNGCKTVAFPCISTGIYGYPNREAAIVACKAVREYLDAQEAEDAETEKDGKKEVVEGNVGDVKGEEEEGGVKLTLEDKENVEKETTSAVDAPAGPSAPAADTSTAGDTEKTDDKKGERVEEKPFLTKIEKVIFCTFLDKDLAAYDNIVPAFFPPVKGMEGSLEKLAAGAAESKADEGAAEKPDVKPDVKPEDKPEVKFETEEKVETKAEGTN